MTAESGARSPPVEVDARRGQRIVVVYLVVASLWIVVGGVVVDRIAARTDSDLFELELVKGLGFVLVTSLFLWRALDRWSARMQVAAQVERQAAERLPRAEEMRRTFLTGISHELRTSSMGSPAGWSRRSTPAADAWPWSATPTTPRSTSQRSSG